METIEIDLSTNQIVDPVREDEIIISFSNGVDIYHNQQYDFYDNELEYFKLEAKIGKNKRF